MANNPQDRDAWVAKRRGHVTASRVGILTRRKKDGQPYAGYDDYLMEVVVERLTEKAAEHYVSDAMQWGLDQEEAAAQHYAFETGQTVAYSDFVAHPAIEWAGASPDRLVGADGLLEIKCPTSRTHIEFIRTEVIPEDYQWQMVWQMACTGRSWCDFMSYDPRLPVNLQARIKRFHLCPDMLSQAEAAVREALAKIAETEAALRGIDLGERRAA